MLAKVKEYSALSDQSVENRILHRACPLEKWTFAQNSVAEMKRKKTLQTCSDLRTKKIVGSST